MPLSCCVLHPGRQDRQCLLSGKIAMNQSQGIMHVSRTTSRHPSSGSRPAAAEAQGVSLRSDGYQQIGCETVLTFPMVHSERLGKAP